jgi:hypothetical protein
MDIKNLAENVASFLSKHSGELRLVGSALETIVSHLPIDAQDKERLLGVTDTLQKAAGNIANGAAAVCAPVASVTATATPASTLSMRTSRFATRCSIGTRRPPKGASLGISPPIN